MKNLLTVVLLASFSTCVAQDIAMQVTASVGGYAESTETAVSMSWTAGETAYTTLSAADGIITQGFQQGALFSTDVEKPKLTNSDIKLYPNPASTEIYIEIAVANAKGKATVELYDITGRLAITEKINTEDKTPCKITVSTLKSGIYMVKITLENPSSTKVFKLVKE